MSNTIDFHQARLEHDWERSDNPVRRVLYEKLRERGEVKPPVSNDPLEQFAEILTVLLLNSTVFQTQ